MSIARALAVVLAFIQGSWMAFDGTRALIVGDYVTPSTGAYAGQLGPWHYVVSSVGIAPRSNAMKLIFVAYGIGWLVIVFGLLRSSPWAGVAAIVAAIGTLWYLPVGTLCSLILLACLLWMRRVA
jgi:hypothetical protein